jgi:hypothetical protein
MADHLNASKSLPANLKSIQHYFDLAKDDEDSCVSYWCKPHEFSFKIVAFF